MLVKFCHDKKDSWDEYLDTCVYAYSTSVHESTAFTQFAIELMFGRKARLPIDIEMDDHTPEECINQADGSVAQSVQVLADQRIEKLQEAKDNIKKAQAKQKQIYDQKHA